MTTTGSLSVLNVGAGDIEIVFNQHDATERDRAVKMLKDMQLRGYAILVRLDDGSYIRAKEIDAERGRYIVQLPDGATHAAAEPVDEPQTGLDDGPPMKARRGRPRKSGIPVTSAHATGVARSAGG